MVTRHDTQQEMTQEQLAAMSYEEREAWWRKQLIAQGIEWGMPETLEWVKALEPEWEDTPEEIADDIRVSKDRLAKSDVLSDVDFLEEIGRENPETAEFFTRMDEYFPKGFEWVNILDPESKQGRLFFRDLKVDFPDAWDFFLATDE